MYSGKWFSGRAVLIDIPSPSVGVPGYTHNRWLLYFLTFTLKDKMFTYVSMTTVDIEQFFNVIVWLILLTHYFQLNKKHTHLAKKKNSHIVNTIKNKFLPLRQLCVSWMSFQKWSKYIKHTSTSIPTLPYFF